MKGATREDERSNLSRFSRKSRESRQYNTMRLFLLSTVHPWHGLCVPTKTMATARIPFVLLITIGFLCGSPQPGTAQPTSAPPSSLPTTPLSSGSTESELRPSCDLCRKPEGRAGSDVRPRRLKRHKGLHPQKQTSGRHRSAEQAMKSTLPHHVSDQTGAQ